ncbi:MAG: hypothetical protein P1U53_05100 [Sulfitobacter sp.]|nr:hypothetical protein [Sulfitobacter sp.]
MSDTDSFIDEVNEEVRRDRLFVLLRRYGWIAVVAILLIVGGAAWNEYQKAQVRAEAERVGDAMLAALSVNQSEERLAALQEIDPGTEGAEAVLAFLTAAQQQEAGDREGAIATLDAIAVDSGVAPIYRDIALFKALALQGEAAGAENRRQALEALAQAGRPLRLLAAEQLALIEIEEGNSEAAIERYQAILNDAEVSPDLQQRALQVIVALGGEPELGETSPLEGVLTPGNDN